MRRYAGLKVAYTAGWTWRFLLTEAAGRYAGLKVAYTAGWTWRFC